MDKQLALHETLELHELLTFKTLCLNKSTLMSSLAKDEELKAVLLNDVNLGSQSIETLQTFVTRRDGN